MPTATGQWWLSMGSVLSRISRVQLFVTPGTIAHQAPLSMGFSRREYWSGFPFLSLGDLPDPGIEPLSLMSPALAGVTWEALSAHVQNGVMFKGLKSRQGALEVWEGASPVGSDSLVLEALSWGS